MVCFLNSSTILLGFESVFKNSVDVNCNEKGEWFRDGLCKSFVYYLIGKKNKRLENIINVFHREIETKNHESEEYFSALLKVLHTLKVKSFQAKVENFDKLNFAISYVETKIKAPFEEDLQQVRSQLEEQLLNWKKKQSLFINKEITKENKKTLYELEKYPHFYSLLVKNEKIRDDFFKWSIRDHNLVDLFVCFPKLCKRLKECHLTGRIGRFARHQLLQVQENGVTFSFEGKSINILNEEQIVTFKNGSSFKISQIFDQFSRKNETVGDFEVFQDGIHFWHSHHLGRKKVHPIASPGYIQRGSYEIIDLTNEKWWEYLPVFEEITKEELSQRIGLDINGDEIAIGMAKGTRQQTQLDVDGVHGFIGVAILQETGLYRIFDFGKYAETFPKTPFDYIRFLGNTVTSKIEYPDSNNYYLFRQTAIIPYILDQEKFISLMNLIKQDIERARDNDLVFQFGWENCAYWPQTLFKKIIKDFPNVFKVPILQTQATNVFLKNLFWFLNSLPRRFQDLGISIVFYLLGYKRGKEVMVNEKKVRKSLFLSPCEQKGENYHMMHNPSFAHYQIERKTLQGKIIRGVLDDEIN